MAWNQPGNDGNNGQRNPWGKKRPTGGSGKFNVQPWLELLKKRFGKFGGGPGGLLTLALALILAWLLLSSYSIIDARQVGVVQRFGQYSRSLEPGFHFKLPSPIETVSKVETTQIRSVSDQVRMLTSDENIILVDFNVQFQVQDARKYLFAVRDPEGSLRQAAEAAVRSVVGASSMDAILASAGAAQDTAAGRLPDQTSATLQQRTRQALQATLDGYGTGIVITDVSFQNMAPPPEVKAAFDDVNAAREDKLAAENQAHAYASQVVPVAKGQAARITAQAQGYQSERVARATGEAERFNLILKAYQAAPEVTRRRLWLETVEEVMAGNPKVLDSTGGRNILNLPLGAAGSGTSKDMPGVGTVESAAETAPQTTPTDADAGKEKQP